MPEQPLPPQNSREGTQPGRPVNPPIPSPRVSGSPQPPPPPTGQYPRANVPPPPMGGHVRTHSPEKRKRSGPSRSRAAASGLYLPWWSIAAMLGTVAVVALVIIGLVVALGGTTPPDTDPRVIIVTAIPSNTPAPGEVPAGAPTATSGLLPAINVPQGAFPTFALEGPTLPPVVLSPTPRTINIGSNVFITEESVRLRDLPGLNTNMIQFLEQNTRLTIVGGPQRADNLTWWQVEGLDDPTLAGWVASNYLQLSD